MGYLPGSRLRGGGRKLLDEIMPANHCYDMVNVSALGDDVRRLILDRVRHKPGFSKTLEAFGIAGTLTTQPPK